MTDYSTEALREALRENALDIVNSLQGGPPTKIARGTAYWGSKASFKLHLTGPKAGLWTDWEVGNRTNGKQGGDIFALIQDRVGCNFAGAVAWGRQFLGWPSEGEYKAPDETERVRRLKETADKKAKQDASAEADNQKRIKEARAIWDRSHSVTGTLGETYIAETRAIPLEIFPDCIKFDPVDGTVVFAASTIDGTIQAIQRIYLTPEGLNTKEQGNKDKTFNKKRSLGVLDGAAVRLPGTEKKGPVCLAEGPETGLSVWAATGYETWITLGNNGIAKIQPPTDRPIIICRDDDPPSSNTIKSVSKVKALWMGDGLRVYEVWPWKTRREDKSDFNDLIRTDGIAGVKARFEGLTDTQPSIAQFAVSLEDAQNLLTSRIGGFFTAAQAHKSSSEPPPVHGCCVTLGVGKTEAAINGVIQFHEQLTLNGDSRGIVFAVPEHKLSAQLRDRLLEKSPNLRVEILRGREAKQPNSDAPMCQNIETVREAESVFAKIKKEVCLECPFQNKCAYLAQEELQADVWIVAHPRMFHPLPAQIASRGIAALIVDESPWQAGLIGVDGIGIRVPVDWMVKGNLPSKDPNLDSVREAFKAAVESKTLDSYVTRQDLINAGFEPARTGLKFDKKTGVWAVGGIKSRAEQARAAEWNRKVEDGHWRDRADNKTLGKMTALWTAADIVLNSTGDDASGLLYYTTNDEGRRDISVRGRKSIHEDWNVPTLLIDATMHEDLIRPYWPQLEVTAKIDVTTPHQRIVQFPDRAFSKAMLAVSDDPKEERRRAKNRTKIRSFICSAHNSRGGKTLVISNKSIITALNLPPHILTAHFNALAGHDQFKDVTTLIVIGRPLPPPAAVEKIASALTGKAPTLLTTENGWYEKQDVWRLQRCQSGYKQVPGVADHHPDPIAEQIMQRIAVDEIMQGIGRGRGVRRTTANPLTVFVLGNAVLPVPVDAFLNDTVVMAQSQEDIMLAEGGIAFDSAAAAAKAYPSLYVSQDAAKKALQRNKEVSESIGTNPYKDFLQGNVPLLPRQLVAVFYRREGPSYRRERAVVDLARIPDPRAHMEGLLGSLAEYDVLDAHPVQTAIVEPLQIPTQPDAKEHVVPDEPAVVINLDLLRAGIRDTHSDMSLLAVQLGVSPSHLSNILRGRRSLPPMLGEQLTEILDQKPKLQGRLL